MISDHGQVTIFLTSYNSKMVQDRAIHYNIAD